MREISKDSLLNWYPKIKDLPIPQPKTEVVVLTEHELEIARADACPRSLTNRVYQVIAKSFTLPVFLRTDLASGKHQWEKTCFYTGAGENDLWRHLYQIIEFNLIADIMGLPFQAIVVREFIPMDCKFLAFYGNMPIAPERRYFINAGKVLCHHPYWIEGAITASLKAPSAEDWRELSAEMNTEPPREIELLSFYAQQIADIFPGFWSVDFCKAKDGRWILIDMATGERSWHPQDCPHNQTVEHDYLRDGLKNVDEMIEYGNNK